MQDRLGDLPSWALEPDEPAPAAGGKKGGDVEMGRMDKEEPEQPTYMTHFFREVEGIKDDIDAIKKATADIGRINEEAIRATTTEKENQLSKKLRPVVEATNKRAKRTKKMLELLKEETGKLKDEDKATESDLRVRENMLNTLTRKFIDEMKLYQGAQQKYKTDIQSKVKRQVQIVKPEATDEEIDQIMKSEGGRDALYREQILAGGVNDQISSTYAKVAGKYEDVKTLEQSVQELHQMFLDFALLTEQQGELLDHIEYQVRTAADHVEDANVDVHEAIEYQKKIRKKQCIIIIIVIVCLIVALFAAGVLP